MSPANSKIEKPPKYGWRECEQCCISIPLRIQKDLVRKRFCSRTCASKWRMHHRLNSRLCDYRTADSTRRQIKSLKKTWAISGHPRIGKAVSKATRKKIAETQKRRYAEHPELKQCGSSHHNWKGGRDYNNQVRREKYHNSLNFRFSSLLRNRLASALQGKSRPGSAVRDLGCNLDAFREYITALFEPGMSWANWGRRGWHIDHIRPLKSFDLTDLDQLRAACHFTNLRPIWASENHSKGAKYEVIS